MESSPLEPDVRRHKRTFAEMSHRVSFSPSPALLDRQPSNISRGSPYSRAPSRVPLMERRRLSHPHNHSIPLLRRSEDMPETQRPRLEHRTSQTIIDLTEEPDLQFIAARNRSEDGRPPQAPPQAPPRLGRSDAEGLEAVIDLTDDNDLIILGGRQISFPQPSIQRHLHHHRPRNGEPPGPFVPLQVHHPNRAPPPGLPYPMIEAFGQYIQGNYPFHNAMQAVGVGFAAMAHQEAGLNIGEMGQFAADQEPPRGLNYAHHAFAAPKPPHVPPKPARDHFTRSPTEDDVVVCPSCEEELVHHKGGMEPPVKKGGRLLSKKDREEHPFWVVRECGHVYCNNCFQNRTSRSHANITFPEIGPSASKKKSSIRCAVEGCESEVKEKSKWVGVFI